jgi:hypothetical protein
LLPLFTQVYRLPATVELCPDCLQTPPALTAAVALDGVIKVRIKKSDNKDLFIVKTLTFFLLGRDRFYLFTRSESNLTLPAISVTV